MIKALVPEASRDTVDVARVPIVLDQSFADSQSFFWMPHVIQQVSQAPRELDVATAPNRLGVGVHHP